MEDWPRYITSLLDPPKWIFYCCCASKVCWRFSGHLPNLDRDLDQGESVRRGFDWAVGPVPRRTIVPHTLGRIGQRVGEDHGDPDQGIGQVGHHCRRGCWKTVVMTLVYFHRQVYNLDLNDLPLDRLTERAQKKKRGKLASAQSDHLGYQPQQAKSQPQQQQHLVPTPAPSTTSHEGHESGVTSHSGGSGNNSIVGPSKHHSGSSPASSRSAILVLNDIPISASYYIGSVYSVRTHFFFAIFLLSPDRILHASHASQRPPSF